MDRFDEIAFKLGWVRVYDDIGVFISNIKDKNGYYSINFPAAKGYEDFNLNHHNIDDKFVNDHINKICCSNKVKEENLDWAIPMLISDYFHHKEDSDNKHIWAEKAMKQNRNLKPEHFGK